MEDQEKVWDDIAPEWHEYKKIPSVGSKTFLESCSGNVLDLGGGSGRHLTKIKDGKYFIQDISNEMLRLAGEKAEKLKIDFEAVHSPMDKIPFEDEFFYYAISISALHCVEGEDKRRKAIEELYRVLKKGGKAYIGVWNFQSKRFNQKKGKEKIVGWRDKGKRYYYLYDEDEVHDLFKSVGFKIVKSENSEMMINFIVEK
ncbi:class I SAM-dependent methyltransferase [archaeon]|jgi:tRNA (uracil-5-)-methyltransferase TRM9|nr:class I SAM-dependent methyltransferase [archaeon]